MDNVLLDFLKEMFLRLGTKSPKFFRVISIISASAALVTGLPGLFQELGITLPAWAEVAQSKTISIAAIVSLFISKLTTQSANAGITQAGELLTKTNDSKLPFTAKEEEATASKPGGVLNQKTPTSSEVITKIDPTI